MLSAQAVEGNTQAAQQQVWIHDINAGGNSRHNIRQPTMGDHLRARAARNFVA